MAFKKFFLIFTVIFWSLQTFASAPLCSGLFVTDTEFLNAQMVQRYPTIKYIVENPDQFVFNMRARFEAQKLKTPNEPYQFDYSEIGIPLIKDITTDLNTFLAELNAKQVLEKSSETTILIDYSLMLLQEANQYLNQGNISYRNTIEFSYFYSRMRGQLETRKQSPLLRFYLFIDRTILNGHHPKSARQEFKLYKQRKFKVINGTGFSPGFIEAAGPFEKAVFNPDKLETVWVPSNAPLGPSIFMRLLSRDINFIGVTSEPVLADGILRPSGDFWIHDVRHESVKYFLLKDYHLKKELTKMQAHQLTTKIDKWLVEINNAVATVHDKELKEAIKLLIFSYHHDRGFPLIPSVYLTPNKQVLYTNILYFMQKTAGEKVKFTKPLKNLKAADRWLKDFWLERIEEEKTFLDSITN